MHKPLFLVLIATVIAAWFTPDQESGSIELSAHAKHANTTTPTTAQVAVRSTQMPDKPVTNASVLQIRRRDGHEMDQASSGLFTPTNRETAMFPPPIETESLHEILEAEAQASPAPTPVVLGRYEDENHSYVLLQYMDESLAVSEGDVIADTFRVEKLEGDTLTLLYLPQNTMQTLDTGQHQ